MSYNKRTDLLFFIISITYFLLSVPIAVTVNNHFVGNEIQKVERVAINNVALVRSHFEASIFMDTFLADSLATLMTIDPDMATNNWDIIAQRLLNKSQNVRNVTASPNNIIRYIYPLKGNESALGIDLSTIPSQNKAIQIAKKMGHVYLDGPVDLIQGGRGMIARYPIYADYPYNKAYWGTISVVIDFDKLLKTSGIYDLKAAEVAIKNTTGTEALIFGNLDTFDNPTTLQVINVPYGKWQIAAKFNIAESSHIDFIQKTVITVLTTAIALIYLLIFLTYRNYKTIHIAAMQDELTQLPNRRYINEILKKMMGNKSNHTPFTLLSIDVNDFKDVNDNFGHDVGDKFLKFIADKLKENVRNTDTVARMGGDEFLVVLNDVHTEQQVTTVLKSLKSKIESRPFYHNQDEIYPSISIGYAIYQSSNTASIDNLMTQADHSMYLNKNAHTYSSKNVSH